MGSAIFAFFLTETQYIKKIRMGEVTIAGNKITKKGFHFNSWKPFGCGLLLCT